MTYKNQFLFWSKTMLFSAILGMSNAATVFLSANYFPIEIMSNIAQTLAMSSMMDLRWCGTEDSSSAGQCIY